MSSKQAKSLKFSRLFGQLAQDAAGSRRHISLNSGRVIPLTAKPPQWLCSVAEQPLHLPPDPGLLQRSGFAVVVAN
jgi:hypothetical protein